MPENVNMEFFDPSSRSFSDADLLRGLGGLSFNIHTKRPWVERGRIWINQPVMVNGKMELRPVESRFHANATLQRDEWIEIDTVVQKIARERLVGIADLQAAGLTYNLANGMGKTILEYQDMNDPGSAEMNMNAEQRGRGDRPKYVTNYLPLPIIYSDFDFGARDLAASRNSGDPLDTTMIEASTRRIMEKAEDLLFTDTSFTYGNGTIYSYISNTVKTTVSLSQNWDASGKTGAEIVQDVLNMKKALINVNHYGPYRLYIPTDYETVMDDDYDSTTPGTTIRERILKIEGITSIKTADRLAADTVVMVEMNSSTVRLINGLAPTVLQWDGNGGLTHHFKVMTIVVPQIRGDQDGNCGICVLS